MDRFCPEDAGGIISWTPRAAPCFCQPLILQRHQVRVERGHQTLCYLRKLTIMMMTLLWLVMIDDDDDGYDGVGEDVVVDDAHHTHQPRPHPDGRTQEHMFVSSSDQPHMHN